MLEPPIAAPPLAAVASLAMSEEAPGQPSDVSSLTTGMARGDEAAWREFDRLYFSRLLRYLLVLTGGREEAAQEALQLTFLRVVRYVKPFSSEKVFWNWLTVVARSCVVDEHRKRTRYFALLDRFIQRREIEEAIRTNRPAADGPPDLLALLQENLATLPEDERSLVERKYFATQPVKAIADETASTAKAVESRLFRIRRKLHDAILAQLHHEQ